jgi:hypothetical protein
MKMKSRQIIITVNNFNQSNKFHQQHLIYILQIKNDFNLTNRNLYNICIQTISHDFYGACLY